MGIDELVEEIAKTIASKTAQAFAPLSLTIALLRHIAHAVAASLHMKYGNAFDQNHKGTFVEISA